MDLMRALRHLFATRWGTRRRFPEATFAAIEQAVSEAELRHAGEIRFAVETALDLPELWSGIGARERALQVFGQLGVWDTEGNNGVLIYVLVADHDVEVVADRAVAQRASQAEWDAITRRIEDEYRAGRFEAGSVAGVRAVGELLARHFPSRGGDRNEQPNQPILL
jgi:uncharacterized membrane protein